MDRGNKINYDYVNAVRHQVEQRNVERSKLEEKTPEKVETFKYREIGVTRNTLVL